MCGVGDDVHAAFGRAGAAAQALPAVGGGSGGRAAVFPCGGAGAGCLIGGFFALGDGAQVAAVAIGHGSVYVGGGQEEDVPRVVQRAEIDEPAAGFIGGAAEGDGEAGGLVVLQVVQRGVAADEAQQLVQEEVQSGGGCLKQFAFGGIHGVFGKPVAAFAAGIVLRGHHLDLGEHGLRGFQPGGAVGIEVGFAVAVAGEELFEAGLDFRLPFKRVPQFVRAVEAGGGQFGLGADEAGQVPHFLIHIGGFGVGHCGEAVKQVLRVGAADDGEHALQDAVKQGLGERDGDVGQEVACAFRADFAHGGPASGEVPAAVIQCVEAADGQQVTVQIVHPAGRQLANPGKLPQAAAFYKTRQCVGIAQGGERQAAGVNFHGVLVAVDIAVFAGEPFVVKRRQPHQAERVVQRFVEACFAKLPGERGNGVGEAFGGFVPRPARCESGNGAGLQQVQAAAGKRPFDVLRKAEMGFGAAGEFGNLRGLFGRQRGLRLPAFGQPENRCAAVCAANQGGGFGGDAAFGQHAFAVYAVFVHRLAARHHGFAQTESGVNQHFVQAAAHGVYGKRHARRFVRAHFRHLLHHHRHGCFFVRQTEPFAIGQHFGVPQAQPALSDGVFQRVGTAHVQQCVVQPCKGCAGQVFRTARRAHGKPAFRLPLLQIRQRTAHFWRQRLRLQISPHRRTLRFGIGLAAQNVAHGLAVRRKPRTVGIGRQHRTGWHGQPRLRRARQPAPFAAGKGGVERVAGMEVQK